MDNSNKINALVDKLQDVSGEYIIYGAHLVALECFRYIKLFSNNAKFLGFAVTSENDNPSMLDDYPVRPIKCYAMNSNAMIIIAAPRKFHKEIKNNAEKAGFNRFVAVSLEDMSIIIGNGLVKRNCFLKTSTNDPTWLDVQDKKGNLICKYPTLYYRRLEANENVLNPSLVTKKMKDSLGNFYPKLEDTLCVYMAFGEREIDAVMKQDLPEWEKPLQVGCSNAQNRYGKNFDDEAPSLSDMNPLFAEMTGTYWIWKHAPQSKYKGLCHYRRHFLLSETDLECLHAGSVDVVLTAPRYVPGGIGNYFLAETPVKQEVMDSIYYAFELLSRMASFDLYSEKGLKKYLDKEFYFPNNMLIARSEIFDDYCKWLFPVLLLMNEFDKIHSYGHFSDRHIAYSAEILTSYYFTNIRRDIKRLTTEYLFIG